MYIQIKIQRFFPINSQQMFIRQSACSILGSRNTNISIDNLADLNDLIGLYTCTPDVTHCYVYMWIIDEWMILKYFYCDMKRYQLTHKVYLISISNITLCDKVCQWLATGRWFSPGTPVSSTNRTDRHDIAEILLRVAINTIALTNLHIWVQLICKLRTSLTHYQILVSGVSNIVIWILYGDRWRKAIQMLFHMVCWYLLNYD